MRRLILPAGVLRLIALYESLAGVIYHDTVGMNITVREDCVVSEPAISFLFPFGKFSSKKSKTGVTFWGQKSDSQQWRDKNF